MHIYIQIILPLFLLNCGSLNKLKTEQPQSNQETEDSGYDGPVENDDRLPGEIDNDPYYQEQPGQSGVASLDPSQTTTTNQEQNSQSNQGNIPTTQQNSTSQPTTGDPATTEQPDPGPQEILLSTNLYNTSIYGTSEGSSFHIKCPNGQVMVGIEGMASNKINQLTVICSPFKAGNFGSGITGKSSTETVGSSGEDPYALNCYNNNVARAIWGKTREGICELHLGCIEIGEKQVSSHVANFEITRECDKNIPLLDKKEKKPFQAQCGADSSAIGIYGRATSYITAIGLICLNFTFPK